MRSPITSHVLDTALGQPAAGIAIQLTFVDGDRQTLVGKGTTDADGRVSEGLIQVSQFQPGTYRIQFDVEAYFAASNTQCFYPDVTITFKVSPGQSHYHIPLLVSPFGYTTYRGS